MGCYAATFVVVLERERGVEGERLRELLEQYNSVWWIRSQRVISIIEQSQAGNSHRPAVLLSALKVLYINCS